MSDPKSSKDPGPPQTNIVDGWIVHHDSLGGGGDLPVAYLHKRTAELECENKNSKASREFENFVIKPVKVRIISDNEGAVGRTLVAVNRTEPKDVLKQRALSKLTREEKEALGL